MTTQVVNTAISIATDALCACNTELGLAAGAHHFVDIWARDAVFATLGANVSSLLPVTKRTIETFLRYQRSDGLIPYRVMRSFSTVGKYMGKPVMRPYPIPNYRSHQSGGIVPDGGLLAIIASAEYVKRSSDKLFLNHHYEALTRAMNWYVHHYQDNLINEWFLCEWADSVLKVGKTLYTNVLYTKALFDMSATARKVRKQEDVKQFSSQAALIHKKLFDTFWNGSYLSDWYDYKRQDYFAAHANFLAILFDLVDREKALSILDFAKEHSVARFTIDTNYPRYPFWRIGPIQHLVGMADYHNRGCLWFQPGIMYALSLWKVGYKKEAKDFFYHIAEQIVRFHGVYEVYERDGAPLKRIFYQSEHPFVWSAGLFLYAFDSLAT